CARGSRDYGKSYYAMDYW
nr:immunoglobulin heavy chain junction region [Mus musculus]